MHQEMIRARDVAEIEGYINAGISQRQDPRQDSAVYSPSSSESAYTVSCDSPTTHTRPALGAGYAQADSSYFAQSEQGSVGSATATPDATSWSEWAIDQRSQRLYRYNAASGTFQWK